MIAPDGFVVLVDYVDEISSELIEIFEEGRDEPAYPPSFPRQELTEFALIDALLDVNDFWLYSPTGVLHRTSWHVISIMFGRDEMSRSRTTLSLFHVDDMKLDIGKIANAARSLDDPQRHSGFQRDKIQVKLHQHDSALATKYAGFDGFYLTVREGQLLPAKDLGVIKSARGGSLEEAQGQTVNDVEALLRSAAESGSLPLRDDFRRMHAPEMKIEAFKAIWRSVASEFPELSRPGPKPTSNSKG